MNAAPLRGDFSDEKSAAGQTSGLLRLSRHGLDYVASSSADLSW
jgi:hypothetical protein